MDVLRLRTDLQFSWIEGSQREDGYWVVKDPLARELYFLTPREKQLLSLADGTKSIQEICHAVPEAIEQRTNLQALLAFFRQARSRGLLIATEPTDSSDSAASTAHVGVARWLLGCLAFRVIRLQPHAFLQRLDLAGKVLMSRWAMLLAVSVAISGLVIAVGRFDQFAQETTTALGRTSMTHWLAIVLVIAIAKSIHELAHAVACRAVGAECREIGVMLLFGAPCLYCDVSDLWRVPNRGRRVLVSSAGMIAECLLAGVAAWVWAWSHPSTIHDLALFVMIVCSVSTLMINGNPLLRYDGYYILVDLLGIPNLARRASQQVIGLARRAVWGDEEPPAVTSRVGRDIGDAWFIAYGVTSGIYRLMILSVLALAMVHFLESFGLRWLGIALFTAVVFAMLRVPFRAVTSGPNDAGETARGVELVWYRHRRARAVTLAAIGAILLLLIVPIPSRVRLPVMLVPQNDRDIMTTRAGLLEEWTDSADPTSGGVVLRLRNDELHRRLMEGRADEAVAEAYLDAAQKSRGVRSPNAEQVGLAERTLQAAREELAQVGREHDRLTVRVDESGGLFFPNWTGGQLTEGERLERGTLLGWTGDATKRDGFAVAPEATVAELSPGQRVRFRHPSLWKDVFGRVERIGQVALKSLPAEMEPLAEKHGELYPVRIRWEGETFGLPIRLTGVAEIQAQRRSLWSRLRRFVFGEFRV